MKEIKNWKMATVFDLESDGLLDKATMFHVLSFHMADGKTGSINGDNHSRFRKFLSYHIDNNIPVVAHNGICFDVALCERLLGIVLGKLMVIDTLAISWYMNTKRKMHGLNSFLEDYGIPKPTIGEAEWIKPIRGIKLSIRKEGKGTEKVKIVTYKYLDDSLNISEEYLVKGLDISKVDSKELELVESKEDHLVRLKEHKDLMVFRCEEDVKINVALWQDLMKRLHEIYTITKSCVDSGRVNPLRVSEDEVTYLDRYVDTSTVDQYVERCLTFLMFKMDCARLQEKTRWKADVEYLEQTESELSLLINTAKDALEAIMPPVPKYTKRTKPKGDPNKKDGTPKVATLKWNETIEQLGMLDFHGNPMVLTTTDEGIVTLLTKYEEPNANSSDQLKRLFFSHGWEPQTFKYVKDNDAMEAWVKGGFRKKDKPVPRMIPQISRDGDEGKELCPSILLLAEKEPEILKYDKYTMIKHRLDTIRGFLRDVSLDGYLQARIGGYTNTLRVQHREIVNLVGVDKPYGENIRGGLTCLEDEILLGSDLSSLEDRVKHHFMLPHDPKYVETMMADDYDPHILTAHSAGMVSDEELEGFKKGTLTGDIKDAVAKSRKGGKTTNYACVPSSMSKVKTKGGWSWVDELSEGDVVIGYDTSTMEYCDSKVLKVEHLLKSPVFQVTLGKDYFVVTKEHAWLTPSGFVHSDDLVLGDLVSNGKSLVVFNGMVNLGKNKDTVCLSTDTNTFILQQFGKEILTGNCVYGGSPDAIARGGGITLDLAKRLHEGYWKLNWSVKAISDEQCVFEDNTKQKWLINPINGIAYSLRTEKDRFSTLCQGTGSYLFDIWVDRILEVMKERFGVKRLTGGFHDEIILCFKDLQNNRDIMTKLVNDAIDWVTSEYMLRRKLGCDIQYGKRYSDIH